MLYLGLNMPTYSRDRKKAHIAEKQNTNSEREENKEKQDVKM